MQRKSEGTMGADRNAAGLQMHSPDPLCIPAQLLAYHTAIAIGDRCRPATQPSESEKEP